MSRLTAMLRLLVVLCVSQMAVFVRSAEAQKLLADGIEELASQISANVSKEQKRKIAVLPFRELDGRTTVLGTYLAEELVTRLFIIGGGLEIVERTMLDKVLEELTLADTGLIDPSTAKEVGRVVGVDAVVTGTITDLRSHMAINCRLIDVQTGRVFGAAQTRIVKDDDVNAIADATMASAKSSDISEPTTDKPQAAPNVSTEEQGFLFEHKNCTSSGTSVSCDVLVTNRQEDRMVVLDGARLIDAFGNEYSGVVKPPGSGRSSGRVDGRYHFGSGSGSQTLVSGVPVKFQITFENVSSSAKVAKLLEIRCRWDMSKRFSAQLRDIPLIGR